MMRFGSFAAAPSIQVRSVSTTWSRLPALRRMIEEPNMTNAATGSFFFSCFFFVLVCNLDKRS